MDFQNHTQPCVLPLVATWGLWAVRRPRPHPSVFTGLAVCRSAIRAGWLGRRTPAALPAAVLSRGEAWAAGRAGIRAEAAASVQSPWLGGRKQEAPGLRTDQGSQPYQPPAGTKALPIPQSQVGHH